MVIDTWVLARADHAPRIVPIIATSRDATVVGVGGRF
jgi:hypothetical protein